MVNNFSLLAAAAADDDDYDEGENQNESEGDDDDDDDDQAEMVVSSSIFYCGRSARFAIAKFALVSLGAVLQRTVDLINRPTSRQDVDRWPEMNGVESEADRLRQTQRQFCVILPAKFNPFSISLFHLVLGRHTLAGRVQLLF